MRRGAPVRPPSSPIPGHIATAVLGQGTPPGGAELAELSGVSFTCALLVFGKRVATVQKRSWRAFPLLCYVIDLNIFSQNL